METTISNFHTSFYIQEIQRLEFHIPHVQILGTNHCGESRRTAFKRRKSFQDALCRRDYSERLFASFDHQIQSENYGRNRDMYIEGIALNISVCVNAMKCSNEITSIDKYIFPP